MGATPWWSRLGPQLCKLAHQRIHLKGHVILPQFKDVNIRVNVFSRVIALGIFVVFSPNPFLD
jgi:hypothetical protein